MTTKTKNGLALCKHCGSGVSLHVVPHDLLDKTEYEVRCMTCHKDHSGLHLSIDEAIDAWNAAHDPHHTTVTLPSSED